MNYFKSLFRRQNPQVYQNLDGHLERTLTTKDFIGLGVGTIVSTSIFTLPGEVAAMHTGPAVIISFLLAAIVAGLVSFAYAEMSSAMPFAGSAYTWITVIFGELPGWVVGWALLAEYLMAGAFIASGISANLRALLASWSITFPAWCAHPLGVQGGLFDGVAILAIIITTVLLNAGAEHATRIENLLVILKVAAIMLFVFVGLQAVKMINFHPFIPAYRHTANGAFGGWQGIYAGTSMIFLSYIGFDSIAANSAEAKNPKRTMPRGIIGSLVIAAVFFIAVSFVLIGVMPYTKYHNSAEPIGMALRATGHSGVAVVVQTIAVIGMLTALIGITMAGSRLIYSFGRDGMLPSWLGKLNAKQQPRNALVTITTVMLIISAFFPFAFLSQLISAGTLIAFIMVAVAIYPLRHREGHDIPVPAFRMPFYPVLPTLATLAALVVFLGLGTSAKFFMLLWLVLGVSIYFLYSHQHSLNGK